MTFDEMKKLITDIVANPDTALVELPGFLEKLKADYETRATATQKVAEQEERIKTLQDTNMRLFLMQTGQATEKPEEPELQGHEAVDQFINELMTEK